MRHRSGYFSDPAALEDIPELEREIPGNGDTAYVRADIADEMLEALERGAESEWCPTRMARHVHFARRAPLELVEAAIAKAKALTDDAPR